MYSIEDDVGYEIYLIPLVAYLFTNPSAKKSILEISAENKITITLTCSAAEADLPDFVKKFI